MPRAARKKSKSGIYHIILRGENRQQIFADNKDREKLLQTLKEVKEKSGCNIFAYCLMSNHIHLLIKENKEPLEIIMRRIGASYVYWYNWRYKRCGHLFQDRFKSEAVEEDEYFLTVIRYIHNNPVKAGIVKNASDYEWSSYRDYLNESGMTDTEFAIELFGGLQGLKSYHEEESSVPCLEMEDDRRLTDEEAQEIIKTKCGMSNCLQLSNMEQVQRDRIIAELKEEGLSTRQIARLTEISRSIILKV
jgi:putative transposase